MSSSTIPVLIIGAGPAGLVSALCLAKNGIPVRIVDKAPTFHVGSRGFGVQPRTFELFKSLGVLDDVQKLATPIPIMRAYKLPGGTIPVKTWNLYEKGDVWPDRPFANGACIGQSELEQVLRDHLAALGISIELNIGLVALEQDTDSVKVTLASFENGEQTDMTELVETRYLIGADGARGNSRKLLGLTFQGETRDADGMVWGDVEITGLGSDFWHIWGKPGHFTIMARPLKPTGNKFGLGITGQNFDPTDLVDPAKVVEFFKQETGRIDLEFGDFTWLSYFKPNMRMVNKFQEGRAFVVGDSAHVHSPTGGQGMNTAVQDASNLTWKLALVLKKLAPESLLLTYNTERLPVITQMLHATSQLYTHTVAKETVAPVENDHGRDNPEDDKKSGWFRWRNSALEMYGINYRYSDIVLEERSTTNFNQNKEDVLAHAYSGYEAQGTLLAGDRAPEAPGLLDGETETTLLQLLKPDLHTVLVFGSIGEDVVDAVRSAPNGTVQVFAIGIAGTGSGGQLGPDINSVVDRDGHAHATYVANGGRESRNIVIIRPDTFIGAILRDGKGVTKYFSKIFGPR